MQYLLSLIEKSNTTDVSLCYRLVISGYYLVFNILKLLIHVTTCIRLVQVVETALTNMYELVLLHFVFFTNKVYYIVIQVDLSVIHCMAKSYQTLLIFKLPFVYS